MNRSRQVAAQAPVAMSSYAQLRLDQTRLLVPQTDVRVLELTNDMVLENPPPGGVGWIRFHEQQYPVFTFSPQLELLAVIPEGRTICALLEADKKLFGLLCNEVALVKPAELKFHMIPTAMVTPGSPFHQLAMYAGKLSCLTSAMKLYSLLPPPGSSTP